MMSDQRKKLHGIIPAIVTPIKETVELAADLLKKQSDYLIRAGVNGLFLCGGTGEGAYLKTEEKLEICRQIKSTAGNDIFLCMAMIRSNTRAVLEEIDKMKDCGADYIVATPPYYHAASQEDIMEHYKQIAVKAFAPVIIYNIPSATHNPIEPDTIGRLAGLQNIAGVKDSSGNFMNFTRGLFERKEEGFAWIQGEDYLCGATLLAGGDGMVSGLSNVRVEPYVEMYRAFLNGDSEKIKACQVRINRLYRLIHLIGNGNAAIKAAMEYYVRGSRRMQQRSMSISNNQMTEVQRILEDYDRDLRTVR
ncbi:dihydrodipicolinate synthase family protein [Schaedlerella sp.]|uniref:dihydrodipicolinate synthase family protein n=1 Tax=Schaedlerella sp. TaxID=2676057 RepID=UPI0037468AFA